MSDNNLELNKEQAIDKLISEISFMTPQVVSYIFKELINSDTTWSQYLLTVAIGLPLGAVGDLDSAHINLKRYLGTLSQKDLLKYFGKSRIRSIVGANTIGKTLSVEEIEAEFVELNEEDSDDEQNDYQDIDDLISDFEDVTEI